METSAKGREFIAAHEGVVTKAYRDVVGVWTIGVGHTANAGPPKPVAGMRITRDEAMAIFARDIAKFEARVNAALPNVPQHVFDAAVSFDFNTGAINRATWVKEYRAGRMASARKAFMAWNKPKQIIGRRTDEAELLFEGKYGAHDNPEVAPSVSTVSEDVRLYQSQLAKLGLYTGPIDGIRGEKTKAAVLAFQQRHDDLVDDGIVGPATRAALARDVASLDGRDPDPEQKPVAGPEEPRGASPEPWWRVLITLLGSLFKKGT